MAGRPRRARADRVRRPRRADLQPLLPADDRDGAALFGLLGESAYWTAIPHTLEGWAIGLAIAIAIAVPVGLALGFNEVLYRAARPVIEFLRPVPSVALIPLAILIYGTGLQSKVFLVAFAATWPLLIQTIYGARDLDPLQLETARSFRIRRRTGSCA